MSRTTHVITLLALGAAPALATPTSAEASCIDEYYTCLNDSFEYDGQHPGEEMADTECGLRYLGCVGRSFKFW
jgi:hypothetical protein